MTTPTAAARVDALVADLAARFPGSAALTSDLATLLTTAPPPFLVLLPLYSDDFLQKIVISIILPEVIILSRQRREW